jgi:hypothetical protein
MILWASIVHFFQSLCCEPEAAVSNLSRAAASRPTVFHQDVLTLIIACGILLLEPEVHGARIHACSTARWIEFLQSLLEARLAGELYITVWSIS